MEAATVASLQLTIERVGQWRAALQHALNETRRQYELVDRLPNDPDVRAKANYEAENLERLRVAALAEYEDADIPVAVENAADDLVTDLAICEKALQEEFFVLVENDDVSAAAPEPQTTPEQQAAPAAPASRESPKSGETASAGTPPAGTGPETTIGEYVVVSDPAAAAAPATPTTATVPALTLRQKARKEATPRHPPPTATPRRLPPTPTDSSSAATSAAPPAAAPTAPTATAPTTSESHRYGGPAFIGRT